MAVAAAMTIFGNIEAAAAVTDEQMAMLHFLFEKNLERALRILDQGGVRRIVSQPSHRTLFQVVGESKGGAEYYLCFSDHFCSCHSFFFDVVGKSNQLCCKHQLAAKLANALQRYMELTMSDEEVAHLLLQC